jgi:ring-1,2-phenylacetyl-CoA epoxidase subunit PaaD
MTAEQARRVLDEVTDPEIPVLSLADLGVLRGVEVVQCPEGDRVVVTLTPTYSGCPALQEMTDDVRRALTSAGCADVEVRLVLAPPWTTDDMTDRGREALRAYGIAPPARGPVAVTIGRRPDVACPQCGSGDTEEVTRFASTSCTSMWRCRSCREPFHHFKAH